MKTVNLSMLLSLAATVYCAPIAEVTVQDEDLAKTYLKHFFNLTEEGGPTVHSGGVDPMTQKIREMQQFSGLRITGKLDTETLAMIKKARCGVSDTVSRFTLFGSKWPRNRLTYRIKNYTPDMTRDEVDYSIYRAFQLWASVTPLRFRRMYWGYADIMISFERGDHGDGHPFDGLGNAKENVYAHAFAPASGGDLHFDDDDTFTFRSPSGVNLFIVAVHELGHSLGLDHSNDPGAVMYRWIPNVNPDTYVLSQDDIKGIQYLYGPNPNMYTANAGLQPPSTPSACDPMLVFDAITTVQGEIFIFKDSFYWHNSPQTTTTVQNLITKLWPKAPVNMDAAYENQEAEKLLFFKGHKVWAFKANQLMRGYPKSISTFGLPHTVKKIDAALHDVGTGKTLFFIGNTYYSYNESRRRMDRGFPKRVDETFSNLPGKVTAAFQYGGSSYIYSGTSMLEYDVASGAFVRVLGNNYFLPCTK